MGRSAFHVLCVASVATFSVADYTNAPYLGYRWMPDVEDTDKVQFSRPNPKGDYGPVRCTRGEACWPTQPEIDEFIEKLDPKLERNLHWKGGMNPRPLPCDLMQADQQPLYGLNEHLKPVYVKQANLSWPHDCPKPWSNDLCKVAARNFPAEGWVPAFVVFPVTVEHVQETVRFAAKHNLCLAVVGTGHDFLNRHSCNDGVLLRTALLKDMDFSPPNHPKGAVKLGSGLSFQEIVKKAEPYNVFLASGWAKTVGILGWSVGGGHGPYAGTVGLGSDNILEVDIVKADGSLVTANATHNTDLYWAVQGGGGSTWGVITAITCKTHPVPEGGFVEYNTIYEGSLCGKGEQEMNETVDAYIDWLKDLDPKWSCLGYFAPLAPAKKDGCPTWKLVLKCLYQGGKNDKDFFQPKTKLSKKIGPSIKVEQSKVDSYASPWQRAIPGDYDIMTNGIDPFEYSTAGGPGLTPSVLLQQDELQGKTFRDVLKNKMISCKTPINGQWLNCQSLQIYSDIPGTRVAKDFVAGNTSINPLYRTAVAHVVLMTSKMSVAEEFYKLGAASYFGESAYHMPNWQERTYGASYAPLLAIKKKHDPNNVFWCRHCIGQELENENTQ